MTLAIARREIVARRAPLVIGLVLVLVASLALPGAYAYAIGRASAFSHVASARELLASVRSYEYFLANDWIARDFARVLCLLALVVGPGAVAGERENKTWPLLFASPGALRAVVLVKFATLSAWLAIVATASTLFAGAASSLEGKSFSAEAIALATVVAWGQGVAFLALVFAASALVRRVPVAAALGLAFSLLAAGALRLAGLDGSALGFAAFDPAGRVDGRLVAVDLGALAALVALGLGAALAIVTYRRAT